MHPLKPPGHRPARAAFTLVELLTVITIIVILVGLIVGAAGFANTRASRSRAESEIKALSTAAENYRADNGIYPRSAKTDLVNPRTDGDPGSTNKTLYTDSSRDLYAMLSGQVTAVGQPNVGASVLYPPPTFAAGLRNYWGDLKPSMLGGKNSNGTFSSGVTAINDPWGFSYGYSTAYQADAEANAATASYQPAKGYNPTFDLWSVANKTGVNNNAVWITNW